MNAKVFRVQRMPMPRGSIRPKKKVSVFLVTCSFTKEQGGGKTFYSREMTKCLSPFEAFIEVLFEILKMFKIFI